MKILANREFLYLRGAEESTETQEILEKLMDKNKSEVVELWVSIMLPINCVVLGRYFTSVNLSLVLEKSRYLQ
jgi:hypothetical protein